MTANISTPQTSQQMVDLLSASVGVPRVRLPEDRAPSLLDLRDGLHHGVASELYHGSGHLGVVSNTALKHFARSPAHYYAYATGAADEGDKPAFAFGRAAHCAILEPDVYARTYVAAPDFGDCRKKENKERRDVWRRENAGKIPLDADEAAVVLRVRDAVRNHPLAGRMIRDGAAELTALWTDAMTGLRCKSRADYYVERLGMIVDVKTCEDASEAAFRRDVFSYRYHFQHALYRAGFAALGAPCRHFVFLAVEKKPPYAVAVYELDERGIAVGHDRVRTLMVRLADCVRKNEWPSYPTKIHTLSTPDWVQ